MDIFRMRCFVTVAECQSLTKAARELFITQPAMTSQMNDLEKELGTKLLKKGGRTIELTLAGQVTLDQFRRILALYDSLQDDIANAEAPERRTLIVGFHGPANWIGLPHLISEFNSACPDVEVSVVIDTWSNLLHLLQNGKIDAAFIEHSELEGLADLSGVTMKEEPICLLFPYDHPFAKRKTIEVRDMADATLIMPEPAIGPRFLHYLTDAMKRAGMRVKTVGLGNHYEATITLALATNGITCMPRSLAADYQTQFAIVPFANLDKQMVYDLAWQRAATNTAISDFVACATSLIGDDGTFFG